MVKKERSTMNFLQLAAERYSVRQFSDRPVERQSLDLVLKAGQLAPTACNFQPQRILVLESREALDRLKECTPYHFSAPLAILVCYDKTVSWKRKYDGDDAGTVDAGIVTTHMMLQAAELGLGTTWVGSFDPDKVRDAFRLPANYVPVAILPIGYPAADARPSVMHDKREPLEKTIFTDAFPG